MNLKLYPILGVLVAAILGVFFYGEHEYHKGEAAVQAKWDADKAAQLARIAQLEAAAQKQDEATAKAVNNIASNYEQEKAHESERTGKIIRDLRAGRLRLYADSARSANVSGTPSSTGSGDAARDGGLPERTSESLVRLVGRCNATRDQLGACQRTVSAYYQLCGPQK
ncbi:MAG: lysis protein [Betaproteobacteria bacterium]|nr:lysis protein [Betaproteobacteria bacterium]